MPGVLWSEIGQDTKIGFQSLTLHFMARNYINSRNSQQAAGKYQLKSTDCKFGGIGKDMKETDLVLEAGLNCSGNRWR